MDPCALSASELSELIGERSLSPVEIVRALLVRIEERNDLLRAYVYVDAKGALEAAHALEGEIARGERRTPLHGVPIAYKDVCDVAGMPTSGGSRLLTGNIAGSDGTVAARLRRAGTIALGKLNTFEFATGGQDVFGEARNPWNLACATGGSSTGPAAALAAYLTPLAVGTDTGGSVRIPASFCGLVALRPTRGRIGRRGILTLSRTFDEAGPMTRTVADCALLFEHMAGAHPGDPERAGVAVPDCRAALEGVRFGVPAPLWGRSDLDVAEGFAAAVRTLQRLGARIEDVALPTASYGLAATWAISYSEALAYHRKTLEERQHEYTRAFFHKIAGAGCLTAEELDVAQRVRETIAAEFAAALERVDAVILPATPFTAYPLGHQHLQGDNGTYTRPVSCTGSPALVVPCGFDRNGLPFGLQFVGRAWDEATLFAIGRAYERAGPWHEARPGAPTLPRSAMPAEAIPPGTTIDAKGVRALATLNGLHFVDDADCAAIAASIGPVKATLAEARHVLEPSTSMRLPASL